MYLGAHISISGGFDKCLDRISDMGGNCLMTFASPPRNFNIPHIPDIQIQRYQEKKRQLGLGPHFFHGIYLINLAADDRSLLKKSIDSLIAYQRLADDIGAIGTIFHIGSHKGTGLAATIDQIVAAINYILDSSPKNTKLILENAAGHSGIIGDAFEELAQILKRVGDRSKIGICLDTQHAYASGYTLNTLLDKFDQALGMKFLSVIHLNDSAVDFSSHRDRHANLGEGRIGLETLKNFVRDPRLSRIPLILEVPGINHTGPGKQDIDLLKSLVV